MSEWLIAQAAGGSLIAPSDVLDGVTSAAGDLGAVAVGFLPIAVGVVVAIKLATRFGPNLVQKLIKG